MCVNVKLLLFDMFLLLTLYHSIKTLLNN